MAGGIPTNYTERRNLWILQWVREHYQPDTKRWYCSGGSRRSNIRCPYQQASPNVEGCPGIAANNDGDSQPDMFDNCPAATNPTQADLDDDGAGDACDPDIDNDGATNGPDNCDTTYNPSQLDADGDGAGDACDGDRDGDGLANTADGCPDVYALTSTGCAVTPTGPVDSDGDGIYNVSDGCPFEYAKTANGCPLPSVTSLSARAKTRHGKRSATISVRTSRAAAVEVTIQRKSATSAGCAYHARCSPRPSASGRR